MPDTVRWEERDRLNVTVEWDGRQFRAQCRDYDLFATGKTLNEARDALWSMIQQYLALTDVQAWNDYFARLQQEMEEDIHNTWASGNDHVAN
jgi:hypothetical protein